MFILLDCKKLKEFILPQAAKMTALGIHDLVSGCTNLAHLNLKSAKLDGIV